MSRYVYYTMLNFDEVYVNMKTWCYHDYIFSSLLVMVDKAGVILFSMSSPPLKFDTDCGTSSDILTTGSF